MIKRNSNKNQTREVVKVDKPTPKGGQIPTSKNPPTPKPKK